MDPKFKGTWTILSGPLTGLAVLATCLLIIECYFRIESYLSQSTPRTVRLYDYRYFDTEGTPRFPADLVAWHRGYDGQDIQIRINSYGYRGVEPISNPTTRIVFIGDSIVFNGGVEFGKTFTYLIEQKLRKDRQDSKLEVLNLGVGDTNVKDYLKKIQYQALSFHPELIVVGLYLNDSIEPLSSQALKQAPILPQFRLQSLDYMANLFKAWKTLHDAKAVSRVDWVADFLKRTYLIDEAAWHSLVLKAQLDWGAAWTDAYWKTVRYYLSEIKEIAERAGTKLNLVIFPVAPQVEIEANYSNLRYPQEQARLLSSELKIPLIDPLQFFREYRDAKIFYDQCHLTVLGNELLSKFLTQALESELLKAEDRPTKN